MLRIAPDSVVALLRSQGPSISVPGVTSCFLSMEEALDFKPNAVILAGPASLHRAQAIAFAGCVDRMLIEKPLAATSEDSRLIRNALISSRCRAIVGYNLRYWSLLARFREIIQEKSQGRLLRLECHVGQHLSSWRSGTDPSLSVSCQKKLGGGVFRELSHEIDYCHWICGTPIRVSGRSSRHLAYGDVEDCADLWMDFSDGSHAVIHMDMIDHSKRRGLRAICELGTVELDFMAPFLRVAGKELDLHDVPLLTSTYEKELLDLLGNGDGSPAATPDDGVAVLEVIESAEAFNKQHES